jgi:predicted secreted protein
MMKTWAALFFVLLPGFMNILLADEVMKLTENDAGKTVELHVGDDLEIILPGNPTTVYVWEPSSLNSTVLKLDKTDFIAGDKAIGSDSEGMDIIKLHAIDEGKSEVSFI